MCAMRRTSFAALVMCMLAFCAAPIGRAQSHSLAAKLHPTRTSSTDLEIGGERAGIPRGERRFLSRDDLLAVSQLFAVDGKDGSFTVPSKVRGVPLDELVREFAAPGSPMAVAICDDKYRASYPREYLAAHNPILVLEFNGKSPAEWAKADGFDKGPYLIAHASFRPSGRAPEFSDEPQIPWGVVRIDFRNEKDVFGPISPRGSQGGTAKAKAGYAIARQNCFRCHNSLGEGGMKSGVNWTVLAAMAANSADFFAAYVRDPKSKNPNAKMEGSPELDQVAVASLIAYFQAFNAASVEGSH
jgi:mono/diheme cytochrome c family protein